jgi:26S proteasome regulatory subunit N9
MAFDAKSRALTDFLQKQADAAPDLAGEYSQMSDLFTRKLWHQLTLLLEAFVKLPAAAPHLQVSYETCS